MYKLMNQVVLSNGQYSHCVTIDTQTGDIFATQKIKKSDFKSV